MVAKELKNRKDRMRKTTLVEPKEMENDGESGEERRRAMNQPLINEEKEKTGEWEKEDKISVPKPETVKREERFRG